MFDNFKRRLKTAWNAFSNPEMFNIKGYSSAGSTYRRRLNYRNGRSIVASVLTRLSIDVAAIKVIHARVDQNGRYISTMDSSLNRCLTEAANIDQTGRAFLQDAALTLFDEGCIAIVPVDTDVDPRSSAGFSIESMRVGKVSEWFARHVRITLYNDRTGMFQDIVMPKDRVAIVENPLYPVMNEPNSTLVRLTQKLADLDNLDKEVSSGKFNMIIQLPYIIKNKLMRDKAELRRIELESQLETSKYGIGYVDGTERIIQLNRPLDNNLMQQIEYLTNSLYAELGITPEVFNGTADEKAMINYYNRTTEPVLAAIVGSMNKSFLSRTAKSQGQKIIFYRDPFSLSSTADIAESADKFTRNAILSTNEFRAIIGYKPVDDPRADELSNKNLNQDSEIAPITTRETVDNSQYYE